MIVAGTKVHVGMSQKEAVQVNRDMTTEDFQEMKAAGDAGGEAALILYVISKGGTCHYDEDSKLKFEMPPLPPEEIERQQHAMRAGLEKYWSENGMV